MENKKIILSLVLLICVCLLGIFSVQTFFTTQTDSGYRRITDLENTYNADAEIAQALEKMKTSQEKAAIITHSNSGQRHIALTFDGLTDRMIVQQILDLLKKYNVKATFFVDGLQAAEDPQTVLNIKKAGYRIESYTYSGITKMENLPTERLVKDFSRGQKIIKVTTDQEANLLKCNDTKYTNQLLQAAKACGFHSVVKNDVFLNVKQIKDAGEADQFVTNIKPGSIVSIKLKINDEPIINEQERTNLRPAIDKQPGLRELPKQAEIRENDIVEGVEKFLIALKKANVTTTYVEEFSQSKIVLKPAKTTFRENTIKIAARVQEQIMALFTCRTAYAAELGDNKAPEIKVISTTEPALSFTFGGLSNKTVVNDVLVRLNNLGIKATFFVLEIEMKKYPETVRKIIANGHELGVGIRPKDGETFEETRTSIMRSRQILQDQFGVTTNLVKQPWAAVADTTKEAVSSLECKLIGQSINVVQTKHKEYTTANQVMAEIFGKSVFSLGRGQIVHFRMDYYTNEQLVGALIETIKQRKVDNIAYVTSFDNPANNLSNNSQYTIKPVGEILKNTRFIYKYPAEPQKIPPFLKNDRPRLAIDEHNFLAEASKRYIGNGDVNYEDRMLGFSKMEARRLDKNGFIHTEDNVIFITFDDWGTDAAINKILYVLRKHQTSAAFFVITNNVLYNPNLLRSIATEGHEIGSHSDQHKPLAVRDLETGKQVRTQDKEEYRQDLAATYQKLLDVTGDVVVNGKASLTRFFRPPTLAISKMGFETLFEAGFEYIVSGSTSTYDYKAENVTKLIETIKDGVYTKEGAVKKGAVLVMHMGDSVVYTAMALDILLTANERKADSDPTKFKVGRLSDYLSADYFQMNRKKTLKSQ